MSRELRRLMRVPDVPEGRERAVAIVNALIADHALQILALIENRVGEPADMDEEIAFGVRSSLFYERLGEQSRKALRMLVDGGAGALVIISENAGHLPTVLWRPLDALPHGWADEQRSVFLGRWR